MSFGVGSRLKAEFLLKKPIIYLSCRLAEPKFSRVNRLDYVRFCEIPVLAGLMKCNTHSSRIKVKLAVYTRHVQHALCVTHWARKMEGARSARAIGNFRLLSVSVLFCTACCAWKCLRKRNQNCWSDRVYCRLAEKMYSPTNPLAPLTVTDLPLRQIRRVRGESTATVSSTTGTEEKEPSKQGKLFKFQEKWKLFHPWLIYQDGAMFCQICISGRCRNAFTQGSKNFKASALNEHLSGKDHKSAVVVPREQENKKKVEKKLLTEKEKGVVLRLKVILWLGFVLNVW